MDIKGYRRDEGGGRNPQVRNGRRGERGKKGRRREKEGARTGGGQSAPTTGGIIDERWGEGGESPLVLLRRSAPLPCSFFVAPASPAAS